MLVCEFRIVIEEYNDEDAVDAAVEVYVASV